MLAYCENCIHRSDKPIAFLKRVAYECNARRDEGIGGVWKCFKHQDIRGCDLYIPRDAVVVYEENDCQYCELCTKPAKYRIKYSGVEVEICGECHRKLLEAISGNALDDIENIIKTYDEKCDEWEVSVKDAD